MRATHLTWSQPGLWLLMLESPGTFALPMEVRVGDMLLRMFSTVATFGSPLDVAASELAIETFVPADDATRRWLAEADF